MAKILAELSRQYRIAYIHSPRHFHKNSLRVERDGKRLLLVGKSKKWQGKNFRILAILKPFKH